MYRLFDYSLQRAGIMPVVHLCQSMCPPGSAQSGHSLAVPSLVSAHLLMQVYDLQTLQLAAGWHTQRNCMSQLCQIGVIRIPAADKYERMSLQESHPQQARGLARPKGQPKAFWCATLLAASCLEALCGRWGHCGYTQ